MRKYVDKTGGLEIEKFDELKSKPSRKPVSEKKEAKLIKATDMLDTAMSYQQAIFVSNPSNNGGSECVFCGTHTSYDNRHVCRDCWETYSKEIFDSFKSLLSDVKIEIQ